MPDIISKSPIHNRNVFAELGWARARMWQFNEITLHAAVDWLQAWAVSKGLVDELGQDAVQAILSRAFQEVRDE